MSEKQGKENFMKKSRIEKLFYWIVALVLSLIPLYNMVINGVYRWHISQPEVYEGALEIGIFILMTLVGILFLKLKTSILFSVILYLTKQGVIIPVLVDYLYIEMLCYIGFAFSNLFTKEKTAKDSIIWNFLAGCSMWGAFAILCSAAGHGGINALRGLTVILFTFSLIINRNKEYRFVFRKIISFYETKVVDNETKIVFILAVFVLATLFAKSNTALDYDSLWYGLRPEKVLIGAHSFYDYLGYTSFVHYYPKLMELLYLPISGLGDYSFIICMNVWCLALMEIVIYNIFEKIMSSLSMSAKLALILLLCSIPAVANIAATAKPDILGCFFVLCASFYGLCYWYGERNILACAYIALFLSTGTKLTYLLWGGIVFIAITLTFILRLVKKEENSNILLQNFISYKFEIVSTIIFVFGVHVRTFLLTGYPIYPIAVEWFNKLGFMAKNYALQISNPRSGDGISYVYRLYQYVFNPSELGHVIMLWTSNVGLFLLIVFFIHWKKINRKKRKEDKLLLVLVLIMSLVSGYYGLTMNNPDGNYFIFPIILVSILLLYFLCDLDCNRVIYYISRPLYMVLAVDIVIMFVSHSSWAYGTKVIDRQIVCDNFDSGIRNEVVLKSSGINQIAEYLRVNLNEARVVTSSMSDESVPRRIDSRIETIDMIANPYFNGGDILQSYESFEQYLEYAKIQGLIVSKDERGIYRDYVDKLIEKGKVVLAISDEAADLFLFISD